MADFMAIPDTWEQFLEMYSFKDAEEHYTNGALIIPVSRVKQMMEFYFSDVAPVVHGKWELCYEDWRHQMDGDKCSACGFEHYGSCISHYHYCPNCGAKMDLEG